MTVNILQEYGNKNERRRYPFADDATLLDTNGAELLDTCLVDAHLYPLLPSGVQLYLASVDIDNHIVTLNRDDTETAYATAELPTVAGSVKVYETLYDRQVGVLVFGEGVLSIQAGSTVRQFEASATPFVASVFINIQQSGVRGFLLPDGTVLTGRVAFIGTDGVRVSSLSGVLRFDMLGTPASLPGVCDEGPAPITKLTVTRLANSPFQVSGPEDDMEPNTIVLSACGYTLDEVCAAKKAQYLPDENGVLPNQITEQEQADICDPPVVPPDPPPDCPETTFVLDITQKAYPAINIVAYSTGLDRNAVRVTGCVLTSGGPGMPVIGKIVQDMNSLDSILKASNSRQFGMNGIRIGFRGQQ